MASCYSLVNRHSGTWQRSGSVCARAGGRQIFKRLARHQELCLCHLFPSHFAIVALATRAPSTPAASTLISILHFSYSSLIGQSKSPLPNWLGVAVYFAGQSMHLFRCPGLDSTRVAHEEGLGNEHKSLVRERPCKADSPCMLSLYLFFYNKAFCHS